MVVNETLTTYGISDISDAIVILVPIILLVSIVSWLFVEFKKNL